jgi:release factor glutamine methyltransferase
VTTIHLLLQEAITELSASSESAVIDASILLAAVLQQSRAYLIAHANEAVTPHQIEQYRKLIHRRALCEPIAYIIGKKECWSREWQVTQDTLIPRPETECLLEWILKNFSPEKKQVADLGTGSGVIALTLALERPLWKIDATDQSAKALLVAKQNAQCHHVSNVSFYQGDWCAALPSHQYDLIVSNPPYIAEIEWNDYADGLLFEPRSALVSGVDGLDAIRQISQEAVSYLKPGGFLALEHGFAQGEAVRERLTALGYTDIETLYDLEQRPRVTIAQNYPS